MNKNLQIKYMGAKMFTMGLGGYIFNEVCGFASGELLISYELSFLHKGYMQKGIGHMVGNNNIINKGINKIKQGKIKKKNILEVKAKFSGEII